MCTRPPDLTDIGLPFHVGREPLSADDGWVCAFYPQDESAVKYELLRKAWSLGRQAWRII